VIARLVAMFVAGIALALPACAQTSRRNVAILVWPGAELLDFTGPAEVFAAAGKHRFFKVYTVGLSKEPLRTQGSVLVKPEFTLEDCPKPDVIVIPGGNMNPVSGNRAVLEWVKQHAANAEIVLSVCTGSFLLAEAGLLDGLEATTHHFGWDALASQYPRVRVVRSERFVDDGKIVTAGGVSAGIDGALHVVEKLHGRDAAEWTAREWMEYRGYPVGN
jgi:transcriptional regulator GlxA family with amidase domain